MMKTFMKSLKLITAYNQTLDRIEGCLATNQAHPRRKSDLMIKHSFDLRESPKRNQTWNLSYDFQDENLNNMFLSLSHPLGEYVLDEVNTGHAPLLG